MTQATIFTTSGLVIMTTLKQGNETLIEKRTAPNDYTRLTHVVILIGNNNSASDTPYVKYDVFMLKLSEVVGVAYTEVT